jgi:hypothetical protein
MSLGGSLWVSAPRTPGAMGKSESGSPAKMSLNFPLISTLLDTATFPKATPIQETV